jgi:hypothetical protein
MNRKSREVNVTVESNDVLNKLEAMIEKLEHMSVQQQASEPKRQRVVDDLIREAQDAVEHVVQWQRRRENEAQIAQAVDAIDKNTATFLRAIKENTATTNQLLTIAEARISQIEQDIVGRDTSAFEADPSVLDEGRFLAAQLAGVEGTEGPGPLFKNAVLPVIPTGLEVLATAVNESDEIEVE